MKTEKPDLWLYEHAAFADGFELVCGVDEAGRGPLAGPVCAAAVILPKDVQIDGLDDSKKLTDKKRRELFDVITASSVSYGIALVDEKTIDEINILQATFRAMAQAIAQLDPSAAGAGRWQPRGGLRPAGTYHRQGRRPVRQHRGGVDPCEGHP